MAGNKYTIMLSYSVLQIRLKGKHDLQTNLMYDLWQDEQPQLSCSITAPGMHELLADKFFLY